MLVLRPAFLYILTAALLCAADPQATPGWRWGQFSLAPSGFLDVIGMSRSATTADSVSTHFGAIPLTETPGESVASIAHSRVMLTSGIGSHFVTYLEADFLNPQADSAPWRWRQYWAAFRIRKWEILGGQGWSLLRMNRKGIATEKDLMNTDVIDPAYHTGIAGARRRQVRVAYHAGRQTAAIAWQNNGDWEGKWALDEETSHYEVAAIKGRYGRVAGQASALWRVNGQLHLIAQQYFARHALNEALNVVSDGVSGFSTLEGAEWHVTPRWEWYSYAGFVRSHRSSGNRLVQQYSTGVNWRLPEASLRGVVTLSLQYSYLGREVWDGRSGDMHFLMYRLRFAVP